MSGFPQPFLVGIEPYLNDDDASSLAQCCKSHMLICYMRALRLFRWNQNVFCMDLYSIFLFPANPLMRMQCAKICIANYRPDQPVAEYPYLTNVVQSLTFDSYMSNVCFKDSSEILSKNAFRLPQKYNQVYGICKKSMAAKCAMAARMNRNDLYFKLRSRSMADSLLFEALPACTSVDCDVKIILHEITRDDRFEQCFNYFLDNWNYTFNFFEHPLVGPAMSSMEDADVGKWFYILLCSRKNLNDAQELQLNLKLSDDRVLKLISDLSYSFISNNYRNMEELVKEQDEIFECATDELEILNLLLFTPTKHVATGRTILWMIHFKHKNNLQKISKLLDISKRLPPTK